MDSLVEGLRFLKKNTVFILNIVASYFTIAMSVKLCSGYYFIPQTVSLWYEIIIIIIIIIIIGRNSIVGKATCYGLDGPGIEPSLQYRGYCFFFPQLKRSGRHVDHPTSSSAEVKERVEQYIYPPLGLNGL